ncbi:hypothetical protein OGZ01_30555 (plasmid) [Vibrio harveyi]|nr:hypothetical protein [Vibrio harveyi]
MTTSLKQKAIGLVLLHKSLNSMMNIKEHGMTAICFCWNVCSKIENLNIVPSEMMLSFGHGMR